MLLKALIIYNYDIHDDVTETKTATVDFPVVIDPEFNVVKNTCIPVHTIVSIEPILHVPKTIDNA